MTVTNDGIPLPRVMIHANDGAPVSSSDPLPVTSAMVAPTTIVSAYQRFTSTTGATTLVTIPAGRTFFGSIGASVSAQTAAAATAIANATAFFSTAGSNAIPAPGNFWAIDARSGANAATGTTGDGASNYGTLDNVYVVAPVGNSVTIQVTTTCTGTNAAVDAFVYGRLL